MKPERIQSDFSNLLGWWKPSETAPYENARALFAQGTAATIFMGAADLRGGEELPDAESRQEPVGFGSPSELLFDVNGLGAIVDHDFLTPFLRALAFQPAIAWTRSANGVLRFG